MAFQESQAGRSIQAEAILRQLQLDHPKEPVVAYNLGLLELGKGDCPAALALFQEAETLNNQIQPMELKSRNILGTRIKAAKGFTKIQARDYQSAVIDLEKALESGDGVPELELKNIRANLQFASTQLKSQKTAGSNITSPDSPDQPPQNTARLEEPSQQLQILANQARNRARTARSLFEPAGDELLRPADPTKKTRRMDW